MGKAQPNVDSLLNVWEDKTQADSVRIEAIRQVTYDGFLFRNPDSGFYYAELMYRFAVEVENKEKEALARNMQGISFGIQGNNREALKYFELSLAAAEESGHAKSIADALNNLGVCWSNIGEYDEAISVYERVILLKKELQDYAGVANALRNLSNPYMEKANYAKALELNLLGLKVCQYYEIKSGIPQAYLFIARIYDMTGQKELSKDYYRKCIALSEEMDNKRTLAASLNNYGKILNSEGDQIQALSYYEQSLEIKRVTFDKLGMANSINNIGLIYYNQEKYELALEYYFEGVEIGKEINDLGVLSSLYSNIGKVYMVKGEMGKAMTYGELGLELAIASKKMEKIESAAVGLHPTYKEIGKYEKAITTYELYTEIRDSLAVGSFSNKLIELQSKIEFERDELILKKEKERQIAIENKAKENKEFITFISLIGGTLLTAFLIIVFVKLRQTRVLSRQILDQKKAIENSHTTLSEQHREITDSINYALRIQESMLPADVDVKKAFSDSFILFLPKDVVSGDFYWMETTEKRKDYVYFAVADCTGHGVPGTMISVICSSALSKALLEDHQFETGALLTRTREIVSERLSKGDNSVNNGMDISLCALNPNTGELEWSGALNPLWILRNGSADFEILKGDRQPIGIVENAKAFTTHRIELQKGDQLFMSTDGFQDQFGGNTALGIQNKKLKAKRLKSMILKNRTKGGASLKAHLESEFRTWQGDLEQLDDVCLMGITI